MDNREKILAAAAELIGESAGDVEAVTVRAIAERAGVGVGLINYHFQTKENLVELCVQRFIGSFISRFRPDVDRELTGADRLGAVLKLVADYLAANPSVSQISILGDLKSPGASDNTMKTVKGLSMSIQGTERPTGGTALLMFALASALQALFLRRDLCAQLFGFDFNRKPERDAMLDLLVYSIFEKE